MARQTVERIKLSGSTNGRGIKLTQTGTGSEETIHTAVNSAGKVDYLYIWAVNDNTANDLLLTVEFGGTTSPEDLIRQTIVHRAGLVPVVFGLPLDGGVVVKAFAATANFVMLYGYVDRVTTE